MKVTLDSLVPVDWTKPFAHGATASLFLARVKGRTTQIAVKKMHVPISPNAVGTSGIEKLLEIKHENLVRV